MMPPGRHLCASASGYAVAVQGLWLFPFCKAKIQDSAADVSSSPTLSLFSSCPEAEAARAKLQLIVQRGLDATSLNKAR